MVTNKYYIYLSALAFLLASCQLRIGQLIYLTPVNRIFIKRFVKQSNCSKQPNDHQ